MCREFTIALALSVVIILLSSQFVSMYRIVLELTRYTVCRLTPKTYANVIALTMLTLLALIYRIHRNNEEIVRLSCVSYKSVEAYEQEKSRLTEKSIAELKKNPRFQEVYEMAQNRKTLYASIVE